MERPSKRPRLSVFEHGTPDNELVDARYNNDMTLKNRFESIFAKYAQDFTGIGDEIDIITGEVIVNNGHLESMATETDLGIDHLAGDFTSAGRSMLRAMTVTLNPDLPGPDDVLMSIETIAENAALVDSNSNDDSEDDAFEQARLSREDTSMSSRNETNEDLSEVGVDTHNSDHDSLFDENVRRSSSVDSLFADGESSDKQEYYRATPMAEPIPIARVRGDEDEDILARFGPHVGKEVLHIIGQRQEAHIEPAWRIPVKIDARQAHRSDPHVSKSSSASRSPNRKVTSLWKLPKSVNKRGREDGSVREESVDPLQEEDSMEARWEDGDESEYEDEGEDEGEEEGEGEGAGEGTGESEDEPNQDIIARASTTADCPYCHTNFGNKSGLMAHWDRILRSKRPKLDDPHDLSILKQARSNAVTQRRDPRLVLYDFRTMVELHEGAGMSFDDIAASNTLRTRKTGLQLQGIYNKHRTPPPFKDSTRQWTAAETKIVHELCKNPLSTISTLRRRLRKRDELEIGNYLARIWLAQLGIDHTTNKPNAEPPRASPTGSVDCSEASPTTAQSEFVTIKEEESDDELFG